MAVYGYMKTLLYTMLCTTLLENSIGFTLADSTPNIDMDGVTNINDTIIANGVTWYNLDGTVVPAFATVTDSAPLARWGTPQNLPDNGSGPTPSSGHAPGGPYFDGDYDYYCGNFATADRDDINTGALEIKDDIYYDNCWAPAGPGECLRLFCYQTSAIWLCNDNSKQLKTSCFNVGYFAQRIMQACCPNVGISGQWFHPTDGYNVVVGYGNCNADVKHPPYPYGEGNNFLCDNNNDNGGGDRKKWI